MAYNNYQQSPFWDFIQSFDPQRGAGVDRPVGGDVSGPPPPAGGPAGHPHHPQAPPPGFGGPFGWGRGGFGTGPWGGRGGHRGRNGRHGPHGGPRRRRESPGSPPSEGEHPEGEHSDGEHSDGSAHDRRRTRRGGSHGRRGHHDTEQSGGDAREASPHGRRGCGRRGGRYGHGRGGPPPPFPAGFDMNGLIAALSSHPLAQTFRNMADQAGTFGVNPQQSGETRAPDADENSFVPPIDVFSTEKAYVLHVSLPGAKKEDVGVHWDEDKGTLNVAGVVYRQGDEAFLQTLAQSERKVGMFERAVKLPPGDVEKEEVDGDMITAKLENGVLVITVPKVEKEWTEVKRVDIE